VLVWQLAETSKLNVQNPIAFLMVMKWRQVAFFSTYDVRNIIRKLLHEVTR